jgi:hypothetical protein
MTTLVSEIPLTVQHQPQHVEEIAPSSRSRITMPKVEPRESLAAKILVAHKSDSEDLERSTDMLIQALVERLPKANSVWFLDDRAKWLRTAVSIFDLVYKADEGEDMEIGVVFSKREIERTA